MSDPDAILSPEAMQRWIDRDELSLRSTRARIGASHEALRARAENAEREKNVTQMYFDEAIAVAEQAEARAENAEQERDAAVELLRMWSVAAFNGRGPVLKATNLFLAGLSDKGEG